MALTLAWRKLRPLIMAERTPQRTVSNEFAATSLVTTPDLTTEEIDAIVLLVERGVVLDMTDLALTMSAALAPASSTSRISHQGLMWAVNSLAECLR